MAKSVATLYHNLSVMLDAGVPLVRSLKTCSANSDRRIRRTLEELTESVSQGNTVGETMTRYPRIFDLLDVTVIRQAELAGSLPESLSLLSDWHEFRQRIIKRIHTGLMLPVTILHIAAFVAPLPSFFLGGWQIDAYLKDVITILLLFFYIPAALIYTIIRMVPSTGLLRRVLDVIVLKIPLLGSAVYRLALTRYCWVFHMLYKAGVPIVDCAERASLNTGNSLVTSSFRGGARSARKGNPVSKGFSARLPGEFLNIWQVGEESGQLEVVLDKLSKNYGQRTEFLFEQFAVWLPRLVYFLVCILIIYFIFKNISLVFGGLSM